MKLLTPPTTAKLLLLLTSFSTTTFAQLLTNGNSQFPTCASTCTLLNQAAQACGGTATSSPQIWSCFCQSGYLTSLHSSPSGICDAFCTNPSDNQQVMTWYNSNCGSDDGISEHSSAGAGTTTVVQTSTSFSTTATAVMTSSSGAALPSTTASGGTVDPDGPSAQSGSWFSTHYKWVIMLIVIFLGLLILALLAVWLKRRHDRKRDLAPAAFNPGITERSTANTNHHHNHHADHTGRPLAPVLPVGAGESGSGRNTPARTREAFMPYGYGYARSESRLGAASPGPGGVGGGAEGRMSPLARGGTPVGELEKEAGMSGAGGKKGGSRRVLVRERDVEREREREREKAMGEGMEIEKI